MLKVQEAIKEATEQLKDMSETASLDAEMLFCHLMQWDRVKLILNKQEELAPKTYDAFKHLVQLRWLGKPVQYIIGTQEFMGLPFEVNENVLIPRADTETLIEEVLTLLKGKGPMRILDIGTGSGAIPIALAYYLENALLWTVDISSEASAVARKNAILNNVEKSIRFLVGDLYAPLDALDSPVLFDMIISNPPYIPTRDIETLQVEVAQHEPRLALDGGEDGLDFYRRLVKDALKHLKDDGIMAFEIGYDQAEAVRSLLSNQGFKKIEVIKDLAGKDRVVIGRLQ